MADETNNGLGWYGFDLDGTIAEDEEVWQGVLHVGKPIEPMCELMKAYHRGGKTVKIFTARLGQKSVDKNGVGEKEIKEAIWKWCDKALGFRPEITCEKDFHMITCYDDRATQVITNMGICLEDLCNAISKSVLDAYRSISKAVLSHREVIGNDKDIKDAMTGLEKVLRCTKGGVPKAEDNK